jgi:hypothetical protein
MEVRESKRAKRKSELRRFFTLSGRAAEHDIWKIPYQRKSAIGLSTLRSRLRASSSLLAWSP